MKKQPSGLIDATFYRQLRGVIHEARRFVHTTANAAMVKAKAAYGDGLIDSLAVKLTAEFGAGSTRSNLRDMRQFHLCFQNGRTLRGELTWSHYRLLITVENEEARPYYAEECA